MVFSTSKAINRLRGVGFEADKAAAIAECDEEAAKLNPEVITADKLAAVLADYKTDMSILRADMMSGFAQLTSRMDGSEGKLESRMDALESKIASRIDGLEAKIEANTKLALKGFEVKALVYGVPIVMASGLLGVNSTTLVTWLIKTISHH